MSCEMRNCASNFVCYDFLCETIPENFDGNILSKETVVGTLICDL